MYSNIWKIKKLVPVAQGFEKGQINFGNNLLMHILIFFRPRPKSHQFGNNYGDRNNLTVSYELAVKKEHFISPNVRIGRPFLDALCNLYQPSNIADIWICFNISQLKFDPFGLKLIEI